MDIVQRIRTFMNASQISSMQFADACSIPRPTLSQILNGRNKKISDEVIAKIHEAYPDLSVLWLLFGEGEMLANAGVSSGAKSPAAGGMNGLNMTGGDTLFDLSPAESGGSVMPPTINFAAETEEEAVYGHSYTVIPPEDASASSGAYGGSVPSAGMRPRPQAELRQETLQNTVQVPADGGKTITNIMIFYSDNSYQSFVPR